jgi:DNA polymerase III epsilon subunit-like protein
MNVNRIDLENVRRMGVSPVAAVAALEAFVRQHFTLAQGQKVVLAGHNIGFDVPFLKRLYKLAGASYSEIFSHRTIDTASIVRFFILADRLTLSGAGSEEAFRHFGVEVAADSRHTALADALATAQLLTRLVEFAANGSRYQATATYHTGEPGESQA